MIFWIRLSDFPPCIFQLSVIYLIWCFATSAKSRSKSFRPTLAAVFPAWNPEISLGQSAPCQSPPGQIFVLFGSRPTRGSQPASLRFPHGSNPRAMRPGGFPRASPRRVATARARAALPLLAQELQVARPPLRHPAVAATPASCRHLPSAFLSLRLTPMVSPPQPTSLCLPLGFRVSWSSLLTDCFS